MAKWADYIITGVWFQSNKNGSEHISHVMLHKDNGDTMDLGIKTSKERVIELLNLKNSIVTAEWSYQRKTWNLGAKVTYIESGGKKYLRTKKDNTVIDNLDNLIDMGYFK